MLKVLVIFVVFCAFLVAQSQGRFASINGARIYYEECGESGVNLVLLHDGLLHSITWDEVWQPLCSKFHVVRYDRRGYGRSEAAHAPFSPEEDLAVLMHAAKMDRAILIGNSSGAGLALDFALAHPAMTEGLVLIGPVVHGMASSAYFLQRGSRNGDSAENWSRDKFLISGADPEARRKLRDALSANSQNFKTGGQFERRPSPPTVLRLNQIEAPALVLVGEADIADVIAYAGAIEAALPIVLMEVWPDCGHLIQLEKPRELFARIERFSALADRLEVPVSPDTLRRYAGQYKFGERAIAISFARARLWLRLPDFPEKPLFAASSSRFFVRTTETEFEFSPESAANGAELVIHNTGGGTIHCLRL
jgi:pimeloyl-ACP methyl ester carboxylesterase